MQKATFFQLDVALLITHEGQSSWRKDNGGVSSGGHPPGGQCVPFQLTKPLARTLATQETDRGDILPKLIVIAAGDGRQSSSTHQLLFKPNNGGTNLGNVHSAGRQ